MRTIKFRGKSEDNSEWSGDIETKPKYTHILPNVPLIED